MVNESMKKHVLHKTTARVGTVTASRPRPTAAAASLLASVLSIPFVAMALVDFFL
jgi:hypothetical protein